MYGIPQHSYTHKINSETLYAADYYTVARQHCRNYSTPEYHISRQQHVTIQWQVLYIQLYFRHKESLNHLLRTQTVLQ